MLTNYLYPLRHGDWVYLTKPYGACPVGTYGKYICWKGEVFEMKTTMGATLLVHPDDINKLSIEGIQSDRDFMLIEASNGFPANTVVHFVRGVSNSGCVFVTDTGCELILPFGNLMRVIDNEEDAPLEYFIQHLPAVM